MLNGYNINPQVVWLKIIHYICKNKLRVWPLMKLHQQQSQDWENTNPQRHQGGARMQSGEWRIDLGSATLSASLWWCWTKWKKWICHRSNSRSWWVAANSMFPSSSRDRRTSPLRPCQRLKHALAFRFCRHPWCKSRILFILWTLKKRNRKRELSCPWIWPMAHLALPQA